MSTHATLPLTTPTGTIIAVNVSEDAFLRDYMDGAYEWIAGTVYRMSPVTSRHNALTTYLTILLSAYLEQRPVAALRTAPFVMRTDNALREPDLMLVLADNPHPLTATAMRGPADLVIEVVSQESSARDYGDKRIEYEAAGVREYWLIDPLREQMTVHDLYHSDQYATRLPTDTHTTPLLPNFRLTVPTLWQATLPGPAAIVQAVAEMVRSA
jgi:Uma2 family endonuclease